MQAPTFEVKTIKEEGNHGQFAIEPLEHGFGYTLGNALRRVLLSSFKGAAITEVKIEGVTHKFSTLEGMSEDMIDLMLNLKEIKVAYEGDEPVTAKLKVAGPAEVTAKDIVAPATVKVVSSDTVIASLAKGAKLDMELTIATGHGYLPAEGRTSDIVGLLPLDAIFSPVERVAYQVESTRVGRRTDFDKLVLDIYTDGSQAPRAVLEEAGRVLAAYFTQIFNPQQVVGDSLVVADNGSTPSVSLDELGLPTRVSNALKNADYLNASDLAKATDKDLKNVKNLGAKSVDLIDEALESKGLNRTK